MRPLYPWSSPENPLEPYLSELCFSPAWVSALALRLKFLAIEQEGKRPASCCV